MKQKKTIPTYRFLRRLIVLPVLVLWLLSMFFLTWAVGWDFYLQLDAQAAEAAEYLAANMDRAPEGWDNRQVMVEHLGFPYLYFHTEPLLPFVLPQTPSSYGNDDWLWGKWEQLYGFQAAVSFSTAQAGPDIHSGNYLFFSYPYNFSGGRYIKETYIALDDLPGGEAFAAQYISSHPIGALSAVMGYRLRLTGQWGEHGDFIPSQIAAYYSDETGYTPIFENPEAAADVTLYTDNARGYHYAPGDAIPVWDYEGEDALPTETGVREILNAGYMAIEDLIVSPRYRQWKFGLLDATLSSTAYGDGGHVEILVYCNPMEYAALRLWPTYLVSLILLITVLWLCLRSVKWKLTEPLAVIDRAYSADRTELPSYAASPLWELQRLGKHFDTVQQDRHNLRNQVTQLETALDYAREAEAHRRQTVSAIAHELKTPLAVIHGYAEGLLDGIAEEKKEQYLSVILEETEKTDELVRQMLELSRLEAGKVRLSADQVDLTALTAAVFEKFHLAAEKKALRFELSLDPVCVTADEARMEQVLTNFVSNAIRYSPEGERIQASLISGPEHIRFTIENRSAPLSPEALEKVWDSFYRGDTARDRSGTGLGLAITKNIIELHRGSCAVRNTKTGVEFSFRLPI